MCNLTSADTWITHCHYIMYGSQHIMRCNFSFYWIRSDAPASIIGGTNIHISHSTSFISFEIYCSHGLWTQIYEYSSRLYSCIQLLPGVSAQAGTRLFPYLSYQMKFTFTGVLHPNPPIRHVFASALIRERTFRFIESSVMWSFRHWTVSLLTVQWF